jgi:uncharacterized protein
VPILVLLATLFAAEPEWSKWIGQKRIVLLYGSPASIQLQLKEFNADPAGFAERDLVLFTPGGDTFRLELIGKDGSTKLKSTKLVTRPQLYSLIDSMPMRQYERRQYEGRQNEKRPQTPAAKLDSADQRAFRLWFTFLAEAQFFNDPERRPRDITDCASLVRYAFREALSRHDPQWIARNALPTIPTLPAIQSLSGPLFITPEGLRHFADAKNLKLHNTRRVSGSIDRARPGDLLFYEQQDQSSPWHVMVYLGKSQLDSSPENWVVYHTGPVNQAAGKHPGEMRRLRVAELLAHPQPRWRPVAGNPAFLGVYRWNILGEQS